MFRQGDVLLVPVTRERWDEVVPDGRLTVGSGRSILARGVATGHEHALEGDVTILESYGVTFVRVDGPVVLRHQEHAPISIPAGIYEVRRQAEYRLGEVQD